MTVRRRAVRAALAAGALGSLGACRVETLEALRAPGLDATADALDATAGAPDAAIAEAGADASGAPADAPSGAADSLAPTACASPLAPLLEWTFDTSDAGIAGWTLSTSPDGSVTASWTGATGDPTEGALQLQTDVDAGADASAGGGATPDASADASADPNAGQTVAHVYAEIPATNLTGRTVSAWIWLESAPSPYVLAYVQTQTTYTWGDHGVTQLVPGTWNCVFFPVSSPVTTSDPTTYDPAHVTRVGFEFIATAPFRVTIDSVRAR